MKKIKRPDFNAELLRLQGEYLVKNEEGDKGTIVKVSHYIALVKMVRKLWEETS